MKKLLTVLVIAVIIASMFSFVACDSSTTETTKIIIKVPALGMDVSLIKDGITSVADFLEIMAESYMAKHEGIEIEIAEYEASKESTFVEDAIGTSSAPDILFDSYYNMQSYAYSGSVVSVDNIIAAIENTKDSATGENYTIDEDALAASKINGKTYMVPFYSQQYVFAYNYSLIKEALQYAKIGRTYYDSSTGMDVNIPAITGNTANGVSKLTVVDELLNNADSVFANSKELAAGKITNFTDDQWDVILECLANYGAKYTYPMMMYSDNTQGDAHIFTMLMNHNATISKDGRVSMNTTGGIQALSRFATSNANGYYPDKAENFDINDCIDLFLNNQLGFCICNNSLYNQYKNSINFGLVNFRGNVCENFYYGFEVFDNGDSEKVSIAKDFIKFIYTGTEDAKGMYENIRYSCCGIPVIKQVENNYSNYITFYKGFSDNLVNCIGGSKDTYSVIAGGITCWNDVRDVLHKEFQELLKGSMTAEEVAQEMDSKANALIDSAKGKLHD